MRIRVAPSHRTILAVAVRRTSPLCGVLAGLVIGQMLLWSTGVLGALLAVFFCVATAWSRFFSDSIRAGVLMAVVTSLPIILYEKQRVEGDDLSMHVVVCEEPRFPKVGQIQFVGELQHVGWTPSKVLVSAVHLPWRNTAKLTVGDSLWFRGSCVAPVHTLNPFSYDASLIRRGITGRCKATLISIPETIFNSTWRAAREYLVGMTYLTGGENEGTGLFLAMTFGIRDLLSETTERAFKDLGLTHLLVVSGYQISLIFGVLLLWATRCISAARICVCPRTAALYPALLGTAGYVWLCGADSATVRALIAGICIALQVRFEFHFGLVHRVFVALLALNILVPFANFELGVQFTVAALLGIASGAYISRNQARWRQYLTVGFHVWLTTSLTNVLWFGSFLPASLPINLLLSAPWSTFNCVCGSVALGISMLPIPLSWSGIPLMMVGIINAWGLSGILSIAVLVQPLAVQCETYTARIGMAVSIFVVLLLCWKRSFRELCISRGRAGAGGVSSTDGNLHRS